MALPFLNRRKQIDQMLAVDLGGRITKAVHLQRRNGDLALSRYALLDAPIYDKTLSVELLSEHLKAVSEALESKTKQVALAVGWSDLVVRNVEMPLMPVDQMRQIIKNNTKTYLQQDLSGYVFDCQIAPPKQQPGKPGKGESNVPKCKVFVVGARKKSIEDLQTAAKNAGLVAEYIVPSLICPVNAFEHAMPEVFAKGIVALVDVGFKQTTICVLQEGELVLTRVVQIGGDKLTTGLAELMGISYAEAEGIKVGMASEVQPQLESLVSPLGRELRASIDFFEHQHDKVLTQVYLSGGTTRSELIVQSLRAELGVECKTWNPTNSLQIMLPPQQLGEVEQVSPQLPGCIGGALTAF
jgi:type IV pilus assembly protein PilM